MTWDPVSNTATGYLPTLLVLKFHLTQLVSKTSLPRLDGLQIY